MKAPQSPPANSRSRKGKASRTTRKRSRERRVFWWTFWIVNILGLLIIIPLLQSTWPLLKILWTTRSVDAVESNEYFRTNTSVGIPTDAEEDDILGDLETQLDRIGHLDESEIALMVEQHFGGTGPPPGEAPEAFDTDSGNYERIDKVYHEQEGKRHHVYIIHLKDRYGRRSRFLEAFERPDADYERTMQLLDLIDRNSQLRIIYESIQSYLARRSNQTEASGPDPDNPPVELRPGTERELLDRSLSE